MALGLGLGSQDICKSSLLTGRQVLTGFGAAPVDSLVQISTTDIFFAHERGTRLSMFALALGTGSYMGPVAAGYITESQSWRWCFWYLVLFFGILLVVQIFSLEESVFRRPLPDLNSRPESLIVVADRRQKSDSTEPSIELKDKAPSITTTLQANILSSEPAITTDPVHTGNAKTCLQRMSLIHTKHANPKPWWFLALFPFRLVIFPAIVWTGILTGIQIWWLSLLSVTQSELFGAAPYNFDIAQGKFSVILRRKRRFANAKKLAKRTLQLSLEVSSACYGADH